MLLISIVTTFSYRNGHLPARTQDYTSFLTPETTPAPAHRQQHLCRAQTQREDVLHGHGDSPGDRHVLPSERGRDLVGPPALRHEPPPGATRHGRRTTAFTGTLPSLPQDKARTKQGRRYPRTSEEMQTVTISLGRPRGSRLLQRLPSTCPTLSSPYRDPWGSVEPHSSMPPHQAISIYLLAVHP